jgi:hypothetical protein
MNISENKFYLAQYLEHVHDINLLFEEVKDIEILHEVNNEIYFKYDNQTYLVKLQDLTSYQELDLDIFIVGLFLELSISDVEDIQPKTIRLETVNTDNELESVEYTYYYDGLNSVATDESLVHDLLLKQAIKEVENEYYSWKNNNSFGLFFYNNPPLNYRDISLEMVDTSCIEEHAYFDINNQRHEVFDITYML